MAFMRVIIWRVGPLSWLLGATMNQYQLTQAFFMRILMFIMLSLISSTACAVDRSEAIEIAEKEFARVWARDFSFLSAEIDSIDASLATIEKDDNSEEMPEIKKISRFSYYYEDPEENKKYIDKLTGRIFWDVEITTVDGIPTGFFIDQKTGEVLY